MEKNIKVSICIANFNGLDIIDMCIDSVLKQTTIATIEIIIHDDFSTDSSANLIKEKYKDVTLIESETNVGFCIANNRMAACAKGEYLLFLNNDAELFADAIDTLLAATQLSEMPTIYGLPQYATDTHALIDCGAFLDPFFNPIPNQKLEQAEVAMVAGACLWIPKKIWVELGGFPEWFESIAEDLYLCCRVRLAGYSVVVLNKSGFYHRVGNSFGGGKIINNKLKTTIARRALSERNKTFVMCICIPMPWVFLLITAHIILLLCEGLVLSICKNNYKLFMVIYVPLPWEIWKHRRELLELRRLTNKARRISAWEWRLFVKWVPHKAYMLLKYGFPSIS